MTAAALDIGIGRGWTPMLQPAGMGANMPLLFPEEGCVVPPAGRVPVACCHAEARMAGNLFVVTRGFDLLGRGPRRKAAGIGRSRLWARFLPDLGRPGSLGRPLFLRGVTA